MDKVYGSSLLGLSIREIAGSVGISVGTVHQMLYELDASDKNYHLLRALAVNLHKNGSNAEEYGREVRLNNILTRAGVWEENIEYLFSMLPEYCLKAGFPPGELVKFLKYFLDFCATYGGDPRYWNENMEAIDRQIALGDDKLARLDTAINMKQARLDDLDTDIW